MPKKVIYHGAYVKVNVDPPLKKEITPRDWCDAARDLMSDITRHCDGIESLTIELDTEAVCEFCAYAWTENSETFNGGCCDGDAQGASPVPWNTEGVHTTELTKKQTAGDTIVLVPAPRPDELGD